ncbi:hypothetical protein M2139_001382 [Enterococcus sp. PF1-24]|nr:hypothetical protein [Enterococcus sp. PFB1-1]MDH6401498.1 hypothetical protein [Enterococcus sp. PF1-24]
MLIICNKSIDLLKLAFYFILVMGIIILLLESIYYIKFGNPFFDNSTLMGFILICYASYNLFV